MSYRAPADRRPSIKLLFATFGGRKLCDNGTTEYPSSEVLYVLYYLLCVCFLGCRGLGRVLCRCGFCVEGMFGLVRFGFCIVCVVRDVFSMMNVNNFSRLTI